MGTSQLTGFIPAGGKEKMVWTKGIEKNPDKKQKNNFFLQGPCRADLDENCCSTWSLVEIDYYIQFLLNKLLKVKLRYEH